MNVSKFLLAIVLAAATVAPVQQAADRDAQNRAAPPAVSEPRVGSVPLQDRGPAFSSPRETMHENGDRVGHYPPYYHPEDGGRR